MNIILLQCISKEKPEKDFFFQIWPNDIDLVQITLGWDHDIYLLFIMQSLC